VFDPNFNIRLIFFIGPKDGGGIEELNMFCPECGSLMFRDAAVFRCSQCDYETDNKGAPQIFITSSREKETAVITENAATLPKTRILCPECGHTEAFFVIRQTRAADEPETRIYRCCKCNASWREY